MQDSQPSSTRTVHIHPLLRLAILLIVAGAVLMPLLAALLGGFKTLGELRVNPFGLPGDRQWQNYWGLLSGKRYWQLMGNSLLISTLTVVLTLVVSAMAAMAAFVFADVQFFGRDFLFNYLLLGLMFPAATAILPLFIKIRDLGLLDSHWGVVLPQVAFGLTAAIVLIRNYFKGLPADLFEAALVDGCGYFSFFRLIVLPLSRPILATVAVITFAHSCNAYLLPLVVLNRDALYPWPLGIMAFQGEFSTDWHLVLAFITLTILPMVLLFFAAQRHIVAGLTAGAVKA